MSFLAYDSICFVTGSFVCKSKNNLKNVLISPAVAPIDQRSNNSNLNPPNIWWSADGRGRQVFSEYTACISIYFGGLMYLNITTPLCHFILQASGLKPLQTDRICWV
jgi:hypothetical protein